ncbi:MAG: GNAT family N-acetyltransferase, partial [Chloroflexota bacterium]
ALARAGMCRLYFLELDGKRVATSICFVYHGRNFIYNSGYDPEYRHLSVGLLNHALCIQSSIDEGLEYFDFMRGDESYKYHLGGSDRAVYDVFASRD